MRRILALLLTLGLGLPSPALGLRAQAGLETDTERELTQALQPAAGLEGDQVAESPVLQEVPAAVGLQRPEAEPISGVDGHWREALLATMPLGIRDPVRILRPGPVEDDSDGGRYALFLKEMQRLEALAKDPGLAEETRFRLEWELAVLWIRYQAQLGQGGRYQLGPIRKSIRTLENIREDQGIWSNLDRLDRIQFFADLAQAHELLGLYHLDPAHPDPRLGNQAREQALWYLDEAVRLTTDGSGQPRPGLDAVHSQLVMRQVAIRDMGQEAGITLGRVTPPEQQRMPLSQNQWEEQELLEYLERTRKLLSMVNSGSRKGQPTDLTTAHKPAVLPSAAGLEGGQEQAIVDQLADADQNSMGVLVVTRAGLEELPGLIRLAQHPEFSPRMLFYGAFAEAQRARLQATGAPVIEEGDITGLVLALLAMPKADRVTVMEEAGALTRALKEVLPASMRVIHLAIGAEIKAILSAFIPEEEMDRFDAEALGTLARLLAA